MKQQSRDVRSMLEFRGLRGCGTERQRGSLITGPAQIPGVVQQPAGRDATAWKQLNPQRAVISEKRGKPERAADGEPFTVGHARARTGKIRTRLLSW